MTRNGTAKVLRRGGPVALSETTERRLLSYMLAAGTVLAASTAQSEVIFTPNHTTLSTGIYEIDVDQDGTYDFAFSANSYFSSRGQDRRLTAAGLNPSASMVDLRVGGAVAALRGQEGIKPSNYFRATGSMAGTSDGFRFGVWQNVRDRYVGVKFLIGGQVHFGWIGFRAVSVSGGGTNAAFFGYAYETVPNKPIRAGDTGSLQVTEVTPEANLPAKPVEQTTLALMATGFSAMPEVRRRAAITE